MSILPNPAEFGAYAFDNIVYAAPGLDYSSDPALQQYIVYHQPSPTYSTRNIDLSLFAEFDFRIGWPFANTHIPINGMARIPSGSGPFPLVLFAHGNHDPIEHSTPGYLYLCELLASHGIIAATIDVNFLNGRNVGENDGRALVHLEHIKQFLLWHQSPGHPLHGKINPACIMIVGHSRGGEAVGYASLINRLTSFQSDATAPSVPLDGSQGLGPYNFAIQALVALAPTDRQYVPLSGPTKVLDNYLVLHGSRDDDVYNFPGYRTFDRSHTVDLAAPTSPASGLKALVWIHGANHNFFNSVWSQESNNTLSRDEQEQIAKVYISAIAQAVLLRKAGYLDLLKDHNSTSTVGWLPPGVTFVSQYQERDRVFLQHFEEPGNSLVVSEPFAGHINVVGVVAEKLQFNLGVSQHLYQETQGGQLNWNGAAGEYQIDFGPEPVDAGSFSVLALRVGQSAEPQNTEGLDQNFTLRFEDGVGEVAIPVSSINRLVYPAQGTDGTGNNGTRKTVLQTLRIPLQQLQSAGLDITHLTAIALVFDRTTTGRIYIDELQLSH